MGIILTELTEVGILIFHITVYFQVHFRMGPYLFPIVIHCRLLSIPNMQDVQRGTSSFRPINRFGRTQSFVSPNMNLGCK